MPWFRLYTEARNDAKLRTLTVEERWVWFCLLCYAAEQDERGCIPPTDPFILAAEVAGGDEELLARTVAKLVRLKVVTDCERGVCFVNFTKRNYDKPSDAPAATRERKRKERETPRDPAPDPVTPPAVTPMSRDVTPGRAGQDGRQRDGADGSIETPPDKRANARAAGAAEPPSPLGSRDVTPSHAQEERREEEKRRDLPPTVDAAGAAPAKSAPTPSEPPPNVTPLRTLAKARNTKVDQVVGAVEAANVPISVTKQDAIAVQGCKQDAAVIAEAYISAFNGEWGAGDGWLRDNLNLRTVCGRIVGYLAWKSGPTARAPVRGGRRLAPGELSQEDLKAIARGERGAAG